MDINTSDIRIHLEYLTKRWDELDAYALFEIRCLYPDQESRVNHKYHKQDIDEAVNFATRMNKSGYNVYVTPNPIRSDIAKKYASDENILGAFYVYCDCDDTESVENVQKDFGDGFVGTFGVYTGMQPKRGHIYYELETPITDLEEFRQIQKAIATKMKSDTAITNPSRIMRLGGTINYPDKGKIERGRIVEVTELIEFTGGRKTIEQLKDNFPSQTPIERWSINLGNFSQQERLDIERCMTNIYNNHEWHNNLLSVTSSLVARGQSDAEIHLFLRGITQSGYTQEQTDATIDEMIQSARSKGFYQERAQNVPAASKHQPDRVPKVERDLFERYEPQDAFLFPRTDFLYGNKHYIRDYCSTTIAMGGIGKSSLVLTEAICMATGRELLGVSTKKCKVAYHNSEDPLVDIKKRVFAITQHYNIPQEELKDLYLASGRAKEVLLMVGDYGIINDDAIDMLEQIIREEEIDLLIFDPLANLHSSSESVENFRTLAKTLSMLADRCHIAIELVHHTRKKQATQTSITPEDARGGSSLIGAVRSARTLNRMSQTEAETLGIDDHTDYFKVEPEGKNNLSRPIDKAIWYKKVGVPIANGDEIVVVEKFVPPSVFEGLSTESLRYLLKAINESKIYLLNNIRVIKNEHKMSLHEFIADFLELDMKSERDKKKVNRIIKSWLETDVLREETISAKEIDPKSYRGGIMTKYIVLGEAQI